MERVIQCKMWCCTQVVGEQQFGDVWISFAFDISKIIAIKNTTDTKNSCFAEGMARIYFASLDNGVTVDIPFEKMLHMWKEWIGSSQNIFCLS